MRTDEQCGQQQEHCNRLGVSTGWNPHPKPAPKHNPKTGKKPTYQQIGDSNFYTSPGSNWLNYSASEDLGVEINSHYDWTSTILGFVISLPFTALTPVYLESVILSKAATSASEEGLTVIMALISEAIGTTSGAFQGGTNFQAVGATIIANSEGNSNATVSIVYPIYEKQTFFGNTYYEESLRFAVLVSNPNTGSITPIFVRNEYQYELLSLFR